MTPADCPGCAQERQARERAERMRSEIDARFNALGERIVALSDEPPCAIELHVDALGARIASLDSDVEKMEAILRDAHAKTTAAESALSAAREECEALRKIVEAAREYRQEQSRLDHNAFADYWEQAMHVADTARALDAILSSVPK